MGRRRIDLPDLDLPDHLALDGFNDIAGDRVGNLAPRLAHEKHIALAQPDIRAAVDDNHVRARFRDAGLPVNRRQGLEDVFYRPAHGHLARAAQRRSEESVASENHLPLFLLLVGRGRALHLDGPDEFVHRQVRHAEGQRDAGLGPVFGEIRDRALHGKPGVFGLQRAVALLPLQQVLPFFQQFLDRALGFLLVHNEDRIGFEQAIRDQPRHAAA